MKYLKTVLRDEIRINAIVSIHYFEFTKDYTFEGESHNFWELVYVDKGKIEVNANEKVYKLKHGDMIFHKPNEFHNLRANGSVAPNLIVLSFYTHSAAMDYFADRLVRIDDSGKKLLAGVIREAENAFSSDLNRSSLRKLEPKLEQLFGSEQLIKIYIEELLIKLVRAEFRDNSSAGQSSTTRENLYENQTMKIIRFMEANISNKLTVSDISEHFNIGSTTLKVMFKRSTGMGVIEFYNNMKIDVAKQLIREDELNFTQIAEKLGYSSIHYLSKHFKKSTGMTPTEYNRSVKSV